MTRCEDREAKKSLEALFRGELDAEGFTRLRAHAATCPDCREAYDRLSRVESALEKRALPSGREALLEQALLARVTAAPANAPDKAKARADAPTRFLPSFFLPAALGLAAAGVLLMVVVPPLLRARETPEWQARSAQAGSAWGVRAFCIGPDGKVQGEARPDGTLACAEGSAVQFSYTAPAAARLSIEATSREGEPLRFFPSEGPPVEVTPGVDTPLPSSTPVRGGWLSGALEVRARFSDAEGRPLGETRLTLTPR